MTVDALEVKLRIEHITSPCNGTAIHDIEILLRDERRRVSQIAVFDDIRTIELVTPGKIQRIFQPSGAVDGGAILAIFRQKCIDFRSFLNIKIDDDTVGATTLAGYQNGLSRPRVVEVGKRYHILIYRR